MVCRTIIDDDELEISKALVENTLDRFRQETLAVENAHHDRDRGSCHNCANCLPVSVAAYG